MKQFLSATYAIPFLASLVASLVFIPLLIRVSMPLGLVDKPDHRKLHAKAIPAVGGIAILLSIITVMFLPDAPLSFIFQQPVLIVTCILLMITGVWDDRMNIRPLYRLLIQLPCSLAVAFSGIRLTSLYGFMGIDEIGTVWQYVLTALVITGATNAFNLIDGIDGLAGGLALINVVVMGILSVQTGNKDLFALLAVIAGALIGFLKNNFHPAKVFMGDGGSLMLGFFMSATGIYLIEHANATGYANLDTVVIIVAALLVVPVFDSLRVYIWRMRRGESPFKADRTHLHHLFLLLGITHKKASVFIYILEIIIVITGFFFHGFATLSLTILIMVLAFLAIGYLLQINSEVEKWLGQIQKMEKETE